MQWLCKGVESMSEDQKQIDVLHHFPGKPDKAESLPGREVAINGNVFSVYLSSNDDKETIDFLTKKALYILDKLKEGGK